MNNSDSKTQEQKSEQALEGEGNYSATRRYNQHLGDAIESGDLEAGADAARRAMEGPEAEELLRAAASAKNGPQAKGKAPNSAPKTSK